MFFNMKYSILFLILLVCYSDVIPHPGKPKTHTPRVYNLQIDASPIQRWSQIVYDYRHGLHLFMSEFQLLPIPSTFFNVIDWYAHHVFVHKDFVAEVDAIAKISGYRFGELFLLNFMYEFSTTKACTTILARTPSGSILHGRNLDFPMMRVLAQLVTQINYYNGAKLMYTIDTVVGSVFTLTGIKYGAFAVNVDTRYTHSNINNLMSVLLDGGIPDCWLLRRVLNEENNYHDVVKRLNNTLVGAPVYFMISGVKDNEGCVIQKDTNSVHGFYELTKNTWFLVQTNYDRDQPDPKTDPRRIAVENRLTEQGKTGFTEKILFNEFMSLWPTFNIETIMTAIMNPGQSYHNTTVWYKSNPTETTQTIY